MRSEIVNDKSISKEYLLVIEADGFVRSVYFTKDEDGSSLDQLQELVGGYIEHVDVRRNLPGVKGRYDIWINEEGKLLGLPVNALATKIAWIGEGDYIAGPAIISRVDDEGNTLPLSPDDVMHFSDMLREVNAAKGGVR